MTARAYAIDKAHSEVTFQVRHLLTKVRGRFSDFAGTVRFDEQRPEHSSVSFTVDAVTIDTNNADRDQHLRSDDFLRSTAINYVRSSRIVRRTRRRTMFRNMTIRGVARNHIAGHLSGNRQRSMGQRRRHRNRSHHQS
jgi:polyisoprenoid-binding protein YceI